MMFATNSQPISDIQVEGISATVWRAWTAGPLLPDLSIVTATGAKPPILRCVCLHSQDVRLEREVQVMPARFQQEWGW